MNLLDVVLVMVVIGYAGSGYWQGFLLGASSTLGLLAGGLVGIVAAPVVLDDFGSSLAVSVAAVLGVLLAASFGQVLGALVGGLLRSTVTWRPARTLDALGGAALSVVACLVVAWALGYAVSGARIPWLGPQVRGSTVLSAVDGVMPDPAEEVLDSFDDLVGSELFPRFLEPFVSERIVEVAPPAAKVLRDPDIRRAGQSVVKILGEAGGCDRGIEGSGFVYAPQRVMTNAHVVAGVSAVTVDVGGEQLPAEVVIFDPGLDVAVLDVDGLDLPALRFDRSVESGASGAVLGYPENGPFTAAPSRVRAEQRLRSPDIYGDDSSPREVLSVRADVRPGNSGGPVVSSAGRVHGVVFAASVTDTSTGYALSAAQVAARAADGRRADEPVSTGECT